MAHLLVCCGVAKITAPTFCNLRDDSRKRIEGLLCSLPELTLNRYLATGIQYHPILFQRVGGGGGTDSRHGVKGLGASCLCQRPEKTEVEKHRTAVPGVLRLNRLLGSKSPHKSDSLGGLLTTQRIFLPKLSGMEETQVNF